MKRLWKWMIFLDEAWKKWPLFSLLLFLCPTSFNIFLLYYIKSDLKFDDVILNPYKLLSRKDSTYTDVFFFFLFYNYKSGREKGKDTR